MTPRLKTAIWVSAALRLGAAEGRFGVVLHKGDPDSGGVLVVLRVPTGISVLSQTRGPDGEEAWLRGTGAGAVDQETADAYIARAQARDPDLWVIEFESRDLLPPFAGTIL